MFKLFKSIFKSIVNPVYNDPQVNDLSKKYPNTFGFFKNRLSPRKKFGLYLTLGIIVSLVFVFMFFSFVENVIHTESIVRADARVINLLQMLRTPEFSNLMLFFTYLGNWEVVFFGALLLCIAFAFYTKYNYIKAILVSIVFGELFVWLVKNIVQRPRPLLVNALIQEGSFSFPSGHAFISISFYGLLTYFLYKNSKTKLQKFLVLLLGLSLIVLIGFSRVYLGVHWPSDVLASYFAGLSFLAIIITMFEIKDKFEPYNNIKVNLDKKFPKYFILALFLTWVIFLGFFFQTHPLNFHSPTKNINMILESEISNNLFLNISKTSEDLMGNPIEPINIIIVGNETSLRNTFEEAGWHENDKINVKTIILDIRALIFNISYPQSPGVPSFWNAEPNNFAFEQPTTKNSIHERHHIHFWKTSLVTDTGKDIWFATAHFDKKIIRKSSSVLIVHDIDPFVDNERDKVKEDLLKTNGVISVKEVNVVNQTLGANAAGSSFYTDGKAEVIFLR